MLATGEELKFVATGRTGRRGAPRGAVGAPIPVTPGPEAVAIFGVGFEEEAVAAVGGATGGLETGVWWGVDIDQRVECGPWRA